MEPGYGYLSLPLVDGRVLHVGPRARISGHVPGAGDGYAEICRMGCFVDATTNQEPGPTSVLRSDGSVIGDVVTVTDAIRLAPESAIAIINAASRLVNEANERARSVADSGDASDRLLYEYVARSAPGLTADIEAAQAIVVAGNRPIDIESLYSDLVDAASEVADTDATAEEPRAFAAFTLPNQRTLLVGPYTMYTALLEDGENTLPIHALTCAVSSWLGDDVTDATLTDASGAMVATPVTLVEAVTAAPDLAVDIVAAARHLIDATLTAAKDETNVDPDSLRLFRAYVAESLPGFTRDFKAAEGVVLRAARAQIDTELG